MNQPNVPTVMLKPGREKSLLRRHPWLFDGAIARVMGNPQIGDTVQVLTAAQQPMGWGSISPRSQIRVRMWNFDPETVVDEAWLATQLRRAIARRQVLLSDPNHTACRLVAAESDGLPGIIVDRYDRVLVCQLLTAGANHWRDRLLQTLMQVLPEFGLACDSLYERSDADVRAKEGLPVQVGLLHGAEPPDLVDIQEGSVRFGVDVRTGHKTGFYLDQRDNRAIAQQVCAGQEVLNCFSYTGGFSVAALAGGAATVVNVDSSTAALTLSEANHQQNGFDGDYAQHLQGDVFQVLRQFRDEARQFDTIILDPPKFVDSQASLQRAARGYKDINRLACLLLRPGGTLFTFSCSGLMPTDLFQKIVADAALDARRETQLVQRLGQSIDHPTLLSFPEGFYLKGLRCRVD